MDELGLAILALLVFPESFEKIVDECPIDAGKHVIGDVLKQLLHDEYVVPMLQDDTGAFKRSLGYDSDFLNDYHFQMTSKGMGVFEKKR